MMFSPSVQFSEILRKRWSFFDLDAHFKLPESRDAALQTVWRILAWHGRRYAQKHEKVPPTIVIDSVDRMAKGDKDIFKQLICLAKDSVDNGDLNVVFVSSGGHVLPLLSQQSEKSRSGVIIRLGDVNLEEAVSFLCTSGFDKSLAECISQLTSGRLIYLQQAVTMKNYYFYSNTDELRRLLLRCLYDIANTDATSARICIGEENVSAKRALLEMLPATDGAVKDHLVQLGYSREQAQDIVQEVLSANLIRLCDDNILKFNTELHRQYVQNYYRKYVSRNLISYIFNWK